MDYDQFKSDVAQLRRQITDAEARFTGLLAKTPLTQAQVAEAANVSLTIRDSGERLRKVFQGWAARET